MYIFQLCSKNAFSYSIYSLNVRPSLPLLQLRLLLLPQWKSYFQMLLKRFFLFWSVLLNVTFQSTALSFWIFNSASHTHKQSQHTMENGNENEVTLKSLFRINIFRYKVAGWLFANSNSIWFDQAILFPIARLSYKYYMEIRASILSSIRNYIHGIATANEKVKDIESFRCDSFFLFLSILLCCSLYFMHFIIVTGHVFFPSYAMRFICNANHHGGRQRIWKRNMEWYDRMSVYVTVDNREKER